LLAEICDPPIVLWCRGDTSLLTRPTIGIVGARRCSSTASEVIDRFVDAFAGAGFLVLSGGARGIDAAAHRAALRAGIPTIVVLGSGFGHPYPPEHICLFDQVVEAGGLLLTEYTDDTAPRPAHFPARNRIVAGLCVAILVHEAGARSGALITARLAAEDYGRDVMVVPGSILDGRSRGSHRAVSEGWAMLVDDPKDAVERVYESQGLLMALSEAAAISARSGSTPSPSVPM
jgi:DNA processing protein